MASTIIQHLNPDDFVKINGLNSDDSPAAWFGQIISVKPPNITCCLLEEQPNHTLVFNGAEHTFHVDTIDDYVQLSQHSSHEEAWKVLGLRMLSSQSPFTFVEIAKEDQLGLHDIGDDDDDDDDDDNESLGSLKDFIASEDEAWTPADPDAPELRPGAAKVVAEIHDAVNEYNEWVPTNTIERGAQRFIDKQWTKAVHADADLHFIKGKSEPDYAHPKKRRRRR